MQTSRKTDIQARRTQKGIHKDDLVWSIEGEKLRSYGSQGQQKSFLIALKLAQFDFLARRTDRQPILLLDDIFDKLDAERVTQLIELVNTHHFGQIFLSDTDRERTSAICRRSTKIQRSSTSKPMGRKDNLESIGDVLKNVVRKYSLEKVEDARVKELWAEFLGEEIRVYPVDAHQRRCALRANGALHGTPRGAN